MVTQLTRKGWLLALRGMVGVLFGLTALWPGTALPVLVWLFGVYALVDGFSALTVSWLGRYESDHGWMLFLKGVAGVASGGLVCLWPNVTALALTFLIAAWTILTGALDVVAVLGLRNMAERERQIAWDNMTKRQRQMAWDSVIERKMRYARAEQIALDNEAERKVRYARAERLGNGLHTEPMRYAAQSADSHPWG